MEKIFEEIQGVSKDVLSVSRMILIDFKKIYEKHKNKKSFIIRYLWDDTVYPEKYDGYLEYTSVMKLPKGWEKLTRLDILYDHEAKGLEDARIEVDETSPIRYADIVMTKPNFDDLAHEVMHLLYYIKTGDVGLTKISNIHGEIYKQEHLINDKLMLNFNDSIYFSIDEEMNCRVIELYIRLKKKLRVVLEEEGYTEYNFKKYFQQYLKEDDVYSTTKWIKECDVIDDIENKGVKYVINFVSLWMYLYKTAGGVDANIDDTFLIKMEKIITTMLHKIWDGKFLIKKLGTDYDVVTEDFAYDFLDKWKLIFIKQCDKLMKKYHKLYAPLREELIEECVD